MTKAELIKTVIELHHAIVGNGTAGINERVKALEIGQRKIFEELTKINAEGTKGVNHRVSKLEEGQERIFKELHALKVSLVRYVSLATGGGMAVGWLLNQFL